MLSLPQNVGEEVSQAFLGAIVEKFCPSKTNHMMDRKRMIFKNLVAACLHPRMRYLDVHYNSLILEHIIWRELPELKYLEHLTIGMAISYDVPHAVHFSKQLVELTCHYRCTNAIIEELAENCHHLYKLDITHLSSVNDECLDLLYSMVNLRILKVEKTGLTQDGCSQLIRRRRNFIRCVTDYYFETDNLAQEQPELSPGNPLVKVGEVCLPLCPKNVAILFSDKIEKFASMGSSYESSGLAKVIRHH